MQQSPLEYADAFSSFILREGQWAARLTSNADTPALDPGSGDLIIDVWYQTKMRTAYLEGLECEAYRLIVARSRALLIISSALPTAGLLFQLVFPISVASSGRI